MSHNDTSGSTPDLKFKLQDDLAYTGTEHPGTKHTGTKHTGTEHTGTELAAQKTPVSQVH